MSSFIALNESIPAYYADSTATSTVYLVWTTYHSLHWQLLYMLYLLSDFNTHAVVAWNTTLQGTVLNTTFNGSSLSCVMNTCRMEVTQGAALIQGWGGVNLYSMNSDGVTFDQNNLILSNMKNFRLQYNKNGVRIPYRWAGISGYRYAYCDGSQLVIGDTSTGAQAVHWAGLNASQILQVGVVNEAIWIGYNESNITIYSTVNWSSLISSTNVSIAWLTDYFGAEVQNDNSNFEQQYFFDLAISDESSGSYESTFIAKSSFYRLRLNSNYNLTQVQVEEVSSILPDTLQHMVSNGQKMLLWGLSSSSFAIKKFDSYDTANPYSLWQFSSNGSASSLIANASIGRQNMLAFAFNDSTQVRQYKMVDCDDYVNSGTSGHECICAAYDGAFCSTVSNGQSSQGGMMIWVIPALLAGLVLLTVGMVFMVRKLRRLWKIRHRTPWKYHASQIMSYEV